MHRLSQRLISDAEQLMHIPDGDGNWQGMVEMMAKEQCWLSSLTLVQDQPRRSTTAKAD